MPGARRRQRQWQSRRSGDGAALKEAERGQMNARLREGWPELGIENGLTVIRAIEGGAAQSLVNGLGEEDTIPGA
ncbi:hypothetical protein PR202_ga12564 [Eleusine coracana subsp. coracana]|uniref:Uncharacterized protein n=1 Tax=Eleusine coracana subsp. coracana TaxID=191504 RepID=A0AAV5CBU9_ELECO|nr:hypothetical protein PR202_ga12564 [Eleusine coracana subsp. coracana]